MKHKTTASHYRTAIEEALDSDSYSGEGMGVNGSELFVSQVDFHPPVRRVRRALGVVGNSPRAGQADAVEARPVDAARDQGIRYSGRASKREGDGTTLVAAEVFLTNSVRALVVAAHAIQPALRIRVAFQSHAVDVRVRPEHQG